MDAFMVVGFRTGNIILLEELLRWHANDIETD